MQIQATIRSNLAEASRLLVGINSVREALRAGQALERVVIAKGAGGPRLQEIIDLCHQMQVSLRFEGRDVLDRAAKGASHQNVIAYRSAESYRTLEEVLEGARLIVVLDGVEDPHNFGAIVRTAHAAGASACVVGERRSAPLTETVSRASAGALAHLPVARVTNISQALEMLKGRGFWVYGLDERGPQRYDQTAFNVPTAIVLGSEGKGVGQNVAKHCDVLLRIPMAGAVSSLNVSVAAGVVLFEWRRRLDSISPSTRR